MKHLTVVTIIMSLLASCNCSKKIETPELLYVTAQKGLTMRSLPDVKKGKKIQKVPFRSRVLVMSGSSKSSKKVWVKIRFGRKSGWVKRSYLSKELYCMSFINALKKDNMAGVRISSGTII
jgi:uncharacterized protein YgiM (DUF1202 family)